VIEIDKEKKRHLRNTMMEKLDQHDPTDTISYRFLKNVASEFVLTISLHIATSLSIFPAIFIDIYFF
jgi:hypothetical protein